MGFSKASARPKSLAMTGPNPSTPRQRARWHLAQLAAPTLSSIVALVVTSNSGYRASSRDLLVTFIALVAVTRLWKTDGRSKKTWGAQRQLLLLAGFVSTAIILPLFLNSPTGGQLEVWASKIGGTEKDGKMVMTALCLGVFLTTSSNTVVRLLLTSNGIPSSPTDPPQTSTPTAGIDTTSIVAMSRKFRGGRIIGALERLFIFALALAGEPTAAALVISAKGLLRYSSAVQTNSTTTSLDEQSEYLVVGSLASWGLALAAVLLISF